MLARKTRLRMDDEIVKQIYFSLLASVGGPYVGRAAKRLVMCSEPPAVWLVC